MRELEGSHRIFTRRSCFFKASLRRGAYYMNRSLSLPFTDRALPSAIRPGGFSHFRLARGARGSRPRPGDSHGAVFPSAPLRRPVFPSRGGGTHRGVSLPAPQRTAAASHCGGPAFKRGNYRAARRSLNRRLIRTRSPIGEPVCRPLCCDRNPASQRSSPHDESRVPTAHPNPPPLDAPCPSPPCRACRARAAALALPCR